MATYKKIMTDNLRHSVPIICASMSIGIFFIFNLINIPTSFSFILGLLCFPFVLPTHDRPRSRRYAIAAIIFGGLLLMVKSSTAYYFLMVSIVFYIIEQFYGKLNHISPLLAIVISPFIGNVVYQWSFPIRLQMSQWAVQTLAAIGFDISAVGNIIWIDGQELSVDPACIGLRMIVTSLVVCVVLISHYSKKNSVKVNPVTTILFLSLSLIFAVFSNYIRLLGLIIFKILPEDPLHDVMGLLSLILYVILPMSVLIHFASRKWKDKTIQEDLNNSNMHQSIGHTWSKPLLMLCLLWALQISVGFQFRQPPKLSNGLNDVGAISQIAGMSQSVTSQGVIKYLADDALIYVKPPAKFYQGSHDPRYCWQGSGYEFSHIQIESVGDKMVYTASLTKNQETLYTAWWYDDANNPTPYEWVWRWETVKNGASYSMINITCSTRTELLSQVVQWSRRGTICDQ